MYLLRRAQVLGFLLGIDLSAASAPGPRPTPASSASASASADSKMEEEYEEEEEGDSADFTAGTPFSSHAFLCGRNLHGLLRALAACCPSRYPVCARCDCGRCVGWRQWTQASPRHRHRTRRRRPRLRLRQLLPPLQQSRRRTRRCDCDGAVTAFHVVCVRDFHATAACRRGPHGDEWTCQGREGTWLSAADAHNGTRR